MKSVLFSLAAFCWTVLVSPAVVKIDEDAF